MVILEKLKRALSNYTFLGPRDILDLVSILNFKTVKKGEHIIREGEFNYHVILVLKGLLRSYVTNEEGQEYTMLFVPEMKNAGSYQTILRNKASVENIIALENSLVAFADFRTFDKFAKDRPSLMLYQNRVLKDLLAFTVDQTWFHVVLTPEQRYLKFCKDFPKLEQRVTQKDLASYLGITATSLSRMRARMAKS
jgi:CRP-like cAMP-binding protein